MCMNCGKQLAHHEIYPVDPKSVQYQEYALLGRGKGNLIRSDTAEKYIQEQVKKLFERRQLVLILDLDNTLIHSEDGVGMASDEPDSITLRDDFLGIYEAKVRPYGYKVKGRPFLKEFILEIMKFYEIYFYTAAIRSYGLSIMEIIKRMVSKGEDFDTVTKNKLKVTFQKERLIARED